MKLRRRNDLFQGFYIRWFQIDNIEALLTSAHVPKVHPQVIRRQEQLPIRTRRDRVDVVSVSIRVASLRCCSDSRFLFNSLWQCDWDPHIGLCQLFVDTRIVLDDRVDIPLLDLP